MGRKLKRAIEMTPNKTKFTFLVLGLVLLASCKGEGVKTESDFDKLTSYFFLIEESNRLVLKEFIMDNHDLNSERSQISKDIIELYEILDGGVVELLDKAGGYNGKGELIRGREKGETLKVFEDLKIFERVDVKLKSIISKSENTPDLFKPYNVEKIRSAMYLITDFWNKDIIADQTIAEAYLGLIVVQNNLLTQELSIYQDITNSN